MIACVATLLKCSRPLHYSSSRTTTSCWRSTVFTCLPWVLGKRNSTQENNGAWQKTHVTDPNCSICIQGHSEAGLKVQWTGVKLWRRVSSASCLIQSPWEQTSWQLTSSHGWNLKKIQVLYRNIKYWGKFRTS